MSDLKSLLKDYISGDKKLPVKIRNKYLTDKFDNVLFIGTERVFTHTSGGIEVTRHLGEVHWEFYQEPKKKVKLAPYYYSYLSTSKDCYTWCITTSLYEDDSEFASATLSYDEFIRCTALEIEIDEE